MIDLNHSSDIVYLIYFSAVEKVLTSAFTGIKQKKLVAGQKSSLSDSERLSLITSPSFSTIEYLKKGDQLSIKVGRKGKQSSVKSINFVMRQLL